MAYWPFRTSTLWTRCTLSIVPAYRIQIQLTYNNQNLTVCISQTDGKIHFILVNLILAFVVPFLLISVSYTRIFVTVSNHRSLAVDAQVSSLLSVHIFFLETR